MASDNGTTTLLIDIFQKQYRPRKLLGRSKSNTDQYLIQLRHFERFLKHEPTLDDLTDDTLAAAMQWMLDGYSCKFKQRSPETVNKFRAHIVSLWNFAAKLGYVARFPTVGDIPVSETTPTAWTEEELAQLFNACRATPGWIGPIKASDYWLALHHWLLCGGERTSASLELRWQWINMTRGIACVPGKVRKTKAAMTYSLSPQCVAALEAIRRPTRELVFQWPGSRGSFYYQIKLLIKRSGLPHHRMGLQTMRRSFASHLEAKCPGAATAALHHSSRSVTQKHYLDQRIIGATAYWESMPAIK